MKTLVIVLCLVAVTVSTVGASNPAVIPIPQEMALQPGYFTLTADAVVNSDSASRKTAALLTARLRTSTGFAFRGHSKEAPGIVLTCKNADPRLGAEGYDLTISSNS